tara:strand:- start:259 stop:678 length:420 start_codon:yes stop_codon:yes gene_type:complete
MNITGHCYCKSIEYRTEVDPGRIGICHCRDCQIFGGSAFRTVAAVAPADFEFTKGQPTYFEKTAASGAVRKMAFCAKCGTHLCSVPKDTNEEGAFISIRIATSEDFAALKPAFEVFCESRVAWQKPLEGTHEFPRMPSG